MVPKPSVVCSLPTSHLISPTLSAPKQRVEGPRAHPHPGQGPPEPRLSAAAPPVALVSSRLPAEAVVFSTRAWWAAGRITLCPGGLFIWVSLHVALTFEVKAVPAFSLELQPVFSERLIFGTTVFLIKMIKIYYILYLKVNTKTNTRWIRLNKHLKNARMSWDVV